MLPPPSLPLPLPSWFSTDWPLRQDLTGRFPIARECEQLQQHLKTSVATVVSVPQLQTLKTATKESFNSRNSGVGGCFTELSAPDTSEGEWPSDRSLHHTDSSRNLIHPSQAFTAGPIHNVSSAVAIPRAFQEAELGGEGENDMHGHLQIASPGFQDHAFEWQLPATGLSGSSVSTFLTSAKREPRDLENSSVGDMSAMTMSNVTSASGEASVSSDSRGDGTDEQQQQHHHQQAASAATQTISDSGPQPAPLKRKRNLPGTPDPDAEVIALSPRTLLATNRFVCEICNKGFQRDQNLQLHRRGHNLPWKLKQRTSKEIRKRVYICPETTCVHHDPARALGDLTGIKKHFCRKHGEKKWKCDKCSKRYAVQSDWKAHMKTCGTREYRCDCGTLFSRRDSFITHRAFCDALAEETARVSAHRQGESQHAGGTESADTTGPSEVSLAFMGASSSPHGSISQLSGGPGGSLISSAASRPGMPNSISNLAFSESGMASLTSRWDPGTMGRRSGPGVTIAGPRLSLWLGTGPGSGPSGVQQMIEGPQIHHSYNQTDSSLSYLMQPPKGMHNAITMAGIRGSTDFDVTHPPKLSSGMMPLHPSSVTLFTSDNGMPGFQGSRLGQSVGMMNHSEGGTGLSHLSSSGLLSNSSSSMSPARKVGGTSIASVSSMYGHEQHGANAQMSATALLQKAAMMGATATNPSLFRSFGLGAEDSSSVILGGALQNAPKDQGRAAAANMPTTSSSPYPLMRRSGDFQSGIQGFMDSIGSSPLGGPAGPNGNPGVQDIINSLSGGAGVFGNGLSNLPSGNISGIMLPSDRFINHQILGERGVNSQSIMLCGGSQSQAMGPLVRGPGGSQPREDGDDKPTLDFLGVGGANGMEGAHGDMGRALSQRDLASIMSIGAGMELLSSNSQNVNMMSEGISGNSPEKSWDSS